MLKTDWIFRESISQDKNDLFMLINTLDTQASENLFKLPLVQTLVDEFWELYMVTIFVSAFVPFIVYAFACVYYFTIHSVRITQNTIISDDSDPELESMSEYVAKLLVISLTFFMICFEVFQLIDKGRVYFYSLQNLVD